ncbi:MAG: hypothetical protein IT462_09810 [Planctomycetes bacterium]|nr:hypothetical protein [Planctomycetota bacterium]
MGLFDRFRPKAAPAAQASKSAPLAPVPEPDTPPPSPGPGAGVKPPTGQLPPRTPSMAAQAAGGKGIFSRLGQGMLGPLDNYVDEKSAEILEQATERAEEFRADTLVQVKTQALELLDTAEKRIDEKLAGIEKMLEERMRAELKMKLRALVWTLVFVLLMAAISIGYVWFKRNYGLENPRTGSGERRAE